MRKIIITILAIAFLAINTKAEEVKQIEIPREVKIEDKTNIIDNRLYIFTQSNKEANRKTLIENLDKLKSVNTIDRVPETWDKGQYIVVNKTLKTLTLYDDGKITKKYPVSLGTKYNPTPNGLRYIQDRVVNPYWGGMFGKYRPVRGGAPNNPLGKRWMGLRQGYGIHGTTQEWSIGTYYTHGCIRLFNEDVAELFELVKVGTPVYIGDEKYLKDTFHIEQLPGEFLFE